MPETLQYQYPEAENQEPVVRFAPTEGSLGVGMYGSMQEALADNLGLYAVCEFVVGTQELTRKEGILYSVGRSFIVLYDENQQNFVICDVFSIKFVTLYLPGHRPWNLTRTPPVPMVDVPGVGTVPAGIFGIGTGQAPRLQSGGWSMPSNQMQQNTMQNTAATGTAGEQNRRFRGSGGNG